jgi:hypothetical protein
LAASYGTPNEGRETKKVRGAMMDLAREKMDIDWGKFRSGGDNELTSRIGKH